MDKPKAMPEGGRDQERAVVEALAEQIKVLVAMARTVRNEPDLSDIWESEDFQGLSQGAKAELRAVAGVPADDEKTEAAAKKTDIDIGNDPRTSWIAEQVSAIVKMSATVHEKPDLSVIWTGDDFTALPPDVQEAAKAWAYEKFKLEPEAETDDEVTAQVEAPAPTETGTENVERKRVPKRRKFAGYRIEREGNAVTVIEEYDEWDERAEDYARRATKTTIGLPAAVAEKAASDPAVAAEVVRFIDDARHDLDRRGVKLFFDCPPDSPEKLCPKWKYFVQGKKSEDTLTVEDLQMPEDILNAVKADPKKFYHGIKKDYDAWFGPLMQKKREDVISERVTENFRANETSVAEASREAVPAPYPPEVIRAGARQQVEMFARIFSPAAAEDHIRYIMDAVRGTLEHPPGGTKRPPVDRDFLWTAVREELFARFQGEENKETLEAVKRAMPKDDAVRRHVERLVNEALGPQEKDEPAGERASIAAYLSGKILGEGTSPEAAAKIRSELASYDETTGTLVVPDAEKMRNAIVNLHKHLTRGGEGSSEKKDA